MKFTLALAALLLSTFVAQASVIAIIDSGVDYRHEALITNMWKNPLELRNRLDDDSNGLVDDIFGWNFAENNNLVIDYKYLGTFSDDPYKFFQLQAKGFLGTLSTEDKDWIAEKRADPEFMKEMQKFGNFVHGTHVSGIAARGNDEAKIMAIKLIPTEASPFITELNFAFDPKIELIKILLDKLAAAQMDQLKTITTYVGTNKADVANGSFGTSYSQLMSMLKQVAPNADETMVSELVKHFLTKLIDNGNKMVGAAPETLFVFAAGNDGTDNDLYPTSPANIQASNVISVGATYERGKLASFSNFGKTSVDVAAPGVIIESAIPGDEYLKVSGTSQAAPYVANIAGQIKDTNPELTAEEIKRIIMGTVDLKPFLLGKVKANGMVNADRAIFAAKLSIKISLNKAILKSRTEVLDIATPKLRFNDEEGFVLPLQSTINF